MPVDNRRSPENEENLGVRLRAEMLPASQVSPRIRALPPRITPGRILTLIILLVLAGSGWFFGIGPGQPGLEKTLIKLVSLVRQAAISSATPTPTCTPTETAVQPTATITKLPTTPLRPTAMIIPVVPTEVPSPAPTDTPGSDCLDFSTISLADVGRELCVQGTVIRVIENPGDTLVVFSDEPGALYLVTYDAHWPDGTEGTCYQVTGKIQRLLSNPVLVFGLYNLPMVCP